MSAPQSKSRLEALDPNTSVERLTVLANSGVQGIPLLVIQNPATPDTLLTKLSRHKLSNVRKAAIKEIRSRENAIYLDISRGVVAKEDYFQCEWAAGTLTLNGAFISEDASQKDRSVLYGLMEIIAFTNVDTSEFFIHSLITQLNPITFTSSNWKVLTEFGDSDLSRRILRMDYMSHLFPFEFMEHTVKHTFWEERLDAAEYISNLPLSLLSLLLTDSNEEVREAAVTNAEKNPNLSLEGLAVFFATNVEGVVDTSLQETFLDVPLYYLKKQFLSL